MHCWANLFYLLWAILTSHWVSFLGKTHKIPEIVAMGELGFGGGDELWTQLSSVFSGERLWLQTEPLTAYLGKPHPKTPKPANGHIEHSGT